MFVWLFDTHLVAAAAAAAAVVVVVVAAVVAAAAVVVSPCFVDHHLFRAAPGFGFGWPFSARDLPLTLW